MYYYRWWTYRKHVVQTPVGRILTEFITQVKHAGLFNSVSCALGHHIAEGRWLADQGILDEYVHFWFHANNGRPEAKFHNYSSWVAAAVYDRCAVTGNRAGLVAMLDDLVNDYAQWEKDKLLPSGMFWQFDVRDGMEESISGSRKDKNARPTINSYMFGNAKAIAAIARWAKRDDVARTFDDKAANLKQLVQKNLWDNPAKFFKAQTGANGLCDAREELGFIPWYFRLPDAGYEEAWAQLVDPRGFWAPFGFTTAERRAAKFRSHGVGNCEWDGAVWPFATSQTLTALGNVLRHYHQDYVSRDDYFKAIRIYTQSMHWDGVPYVGEYLDEMNGKWLKGPNPRSRYYNHSTYCDLIISGLVGVTPRVDETIEINPLLPSDAWDWFCLDNVPYHGRKLTIIWDRAGRQFGKGSGLTLFADDKQIAHSDKLAPIQGTAA